MVYCSSKQKTVKNIFKIEQEINIWEKKLPKTISDNYKSESELLYFNVENFLIFQEAIDFVIFVFWRWGIFNLFCF